MLQKGLYPYKYMDSYRRFNEISLPLKNEFCSNLIIKETTVTDYKHTRKIWEDFGIKNPCDYHYLYV